MNYRFDLELSVVGREKRQGEICTLLLDGPLADIEGLRIEVSVSASSPKVFVVGIYDRQDHLDVDDLDRVAKELLSVPWVQGVGFRHNRKAW